MQGQEGQGLGQQRTDKVESWNQVSHQVPGDGLRQPEAVARERLLGEALDEEYEHSEKAFLKGGSTAAVGRSSSQEGAGPVATNA